MHCPGYFNNIGMSRIEVNYVVVETQRVSRTLGGLPEVAGRDVWPCLYLDDL